MNIYIEGFRSNNSNLTFDDVVMNLKTGATPEGVISLWFETKDKYINVDANGSMFGPDYSGMFIYLTSIIYDDETGRYLDADDGDEYFDHPQYWYAHLVIETGNLNYDAVVIPLKHEYFISYVPDHMLMDHDVLRDANVIEVCYDE